MSEGRWETCTEYFGRIGGQSCYVKTRDGTRIHYWSFGSGKQTIAICDGLACDGFNWKYFVPAFQNSFRILLVNYRGHGLSEDPYDYRSLTVQQLSEDFEEVLDHAKVQSALVMGYSLGVQVALEFAHRRPRRVRGMLLVCGSYQYPIDTFHDSSTLKQAFPLVYYMATRFPGLVRPLWRIGTLSPLTLRTAMLFETNPRLVRSEDLKPYFSHLARVDVDVFARMLNFASQHSAEPYLPHIKVPVLIIAGERDSFTPVWVSKLMQERLPKAELLVVRSGTHAAYLEQPLLVNMKMEEFMRNNRWLPQSLPMELLGRQNPQRGSSST